jgi:signal transduction histidine kinase
LVRRRGHPSRGRLTLAPWNLELQAIRQPIAAAAINARASLRWLRREPPEIEEARQTLLRIVDDMNRAAAIIERNRSLYRRQRPQREPTDLNEIRQMVVLLHDAANRHSISIRTDLDAGLPTTTADRVQLQQVLMNLMLNGIEATQDDRGELIVASKQTEDGQLLISVSDSGVGLPGETPERIFDAFFTTEPQGTGMGLSICRRIIELHGGRLWAHANTGRGVGRSTHLAQRGDGVFAIGTVTARRAGRP